MVYTDYFGMVSIGYWEYSLMFFYLAGLYFYFARQKNLMMRTAPEYRFFLWGLYSKVLGGIFLGLIYFYYYEGGDTIGYFYSAVPLSRMAKLDLPTYIHLLFGDNSLENRQYFTAETGLPYHYLYQDPRAYMVIRLISPLVIISFDSYLITTVLIASLSYVGVWRCYRTFVRYYPRISGELAVAFLFMPSCIFWGSGILKDTITFSAFCWLIHCVDNIFFRKEKRLSSTILIIVSTWLILAIKPYIFMAAFPLLLVWIFYQRLQRFRNALVRYVLLPILMTSLVVVTVVVMSSLGGTLGKFSLDSALDTILVSQNDLKRSEEYGSNYFDIGAIEPTWSSVLSKFPVATNAALFRPYLWECKNVVMMLAGLENLFLMFIALRLLLRSRVVLIITMLRKNPIVLLCILFSLFYGFLTGVTTPNFGALVRFKIPLLPLFVSGVYIMLHMLDRRRAARAQGLNFRFEDFVFGDPGTRTPRTRKKPQPA